MSYSNAHYLVETDWLARNLDNRNLRILDATGMLTSKFENIAEERHYAEGHIPGAMFFDVASAKGALSDSSSKLPWMWPSKAQLEQAMSQHGVDTDSHVVLYAATPRPGIDNGTMWCTRAWWTMHQMGVNVSILNGGWEAWVAEGQPISTEKSVYPEANFVATSDGLHAVVGKQEVLEASAGQPGVCLVDALSHASYAGKDKVKYGKRKGHISGAVSLPMFSMLDKNSGKFLDADRLSKRLEEAGLLSAERVITYCGGGIAATVDAFCLALMGHENVAVYDASLLEWAADESLPMTDPAG